METGLQRIFLNAVLKLSAAALMVTSAIATANDAVDVNVKADVERRQVVDELLDTEDLEVGIRGGVISIEDFESSGWLNAHLAYHINEHFYLKANYAWAEGGDTSFEKLVNSAPLLTEDERDLRYYGLNIGVNLFPGEIFFTKDMVFNQVFSVELGGGSTDFAGDDQFTFDLSANYRIFFTDWIAWDVTITDLIFDSEVFGESKTTHNLVFSTGIAFYF